MSLNMHRESDRFFNHFLLMIKDGGCTTECCIFQLTFGCCAHLKAGWNIFGRFLTFFVNFKPFSVISLLKSYKSVWKLTKKCDFFYLPALQRWLLKKENRMILSRCYYKSSIEAGSNSKECNVTQPCIVGENCVYLTNLVTGSFSSIAMLKLPCLFQLVYICRVEEIQFAK